MSIGVSKERMLVFCIISIVMAISLFEPIYGFTRVSEGTRYTFLHNYPEDYFYYLHVMRQGYEGAWKVTSRMTPEFFPPQFAAPFFLLLGKVGTILPLSMESLYFASRLLGAIAIMIVLYRVIQILFDTVIIRIWAFILTLSGTFFPSIYNGGLSIPDLIKSWTELDPIERIAFIPHHLWSKVLLLVLFLVITRKETRGYRFAVVALLTVIMGFISPVILVTYVITIGLWLVWERKIPQTIICLVGIASAGVVALYHWYLSHSVFPWTTYSPPWENNWLLLYSPLSYIQSSAYCFRSRSWAYLESFVKIRLFVC